MVHLYPLRVTNPLFVSRAAVFCAILSHPQVLSCTRVLSFSPPLQDFGSKFGINHRAFTTIYNGHQGIADWIEYLTDFDFNDMQWTFSPAPGGVNANFEVSLGVKATGKTTDRYTAVLRYMMTDGLCTKCTLHISDTVSVNAAL